jgi:hypothetical protein
VAAVGTAHRSDDYVDIHGLMTAAKLVALATLRLLGTA